MPEMTAYMHGRVTMRDPSDNAQRRADSAKSREICCNDVICSMDTR